MNIHALLISRFSQALSDMGINNAPIPVARSGRPEFGEYQFNGAMALAKQLKQKPRDIATSILEHVKLEDVASKLEIAGPGFINIHLADSWLAQQCQQALEDTRSGIPAQDAQTVVVDYSSLTWPKKCTLVTCVPPLLVTRWLNCWNFLATRLSVRTTWATGALSLVCCWRT